MQLFFLGILLTAGYVSADGVCSQPAVTGLCRAAAPRYFFNSNTGRCEEFTYGGCGGNSNNFKTMEECENRCPMKEMDAEYVCNFPPIDFFLPPCSTDGASKVRYTFDRRNGVCRKVQYAGCGTTANTFETEEDCKRKCRAMSDRYLMDQMEMEANLRSSDG